MSYKKYIADVDEDRCESVLNDWKWLINDKYKAIQITKFGDLILRHEDDSIFYLSTISAELKKVASSFDEYEEKTNDPNNRQEWFGVEFVEGQELLDIVPSKNECLSFDHPPCLGGEFLPENIKTCDVYVHFSIMGQIHRQVKDLPPGTKIDSIKIDEPKSKGILGWLKGIFR
jgi:hypothetical protein